ncbi:MAG TPA: N-acetylneuraminate synthase [Gammaproteobacteria bacterium]|nr:N-acetylneuraminate synthase [Gammaproteobacteria bacterium]
MDRPLIVAEVGCNHKGDMAIAREMIRSAAQFAKADYVKFQKRCNAELLTKEEYDAPHPNPGHSFGENYGRHREFLEFGVDQHRELMTICREFGIGYSSSVWDVTSAAEIASLNPDFIKIPSACNLNIRMLEYLAQHYDGDIHVSLGMTTLEEQASIAGLFRALGVSDRLVFYSCTSGYPVPHEDVCLLEITRLKECYGDEIKAVGFSGHHLGIAVDMAAIALGATWVERHFTLDRTWKGTDHAASLEPDGLRKLVRDAGVVKKALMLKNTPVLEIESEQRGKLKRLPGVHFPG